MSDVEVIPETCCLCPPNCEGVDAEPPAVACIVECAFCMHGCPEPVDVEPCQRCPRNEGPGLLAELLALDDLHESMCDTTMGPPGPFPCDCKAPGVIERIRRWVAP